MTRLCCVTYTDEDTCVNTTDDNRPKMCPTDREIWNGCTWDAEKSNCKAVVRGRPESGSSSSSSSFSSLDGIDEDNGEEEIESILVEAIDAAIESSN